MSLPHRLLLLGALAVLPACLTLADAVRAASLDTPDRTRFDAFLAEGHADAFSAFEAHLREAEVADVVPAWTLRRQGTDWRSLGEPAFAEPPRGQWAGMVRTLEVLRDDIIPATGPVSVVSGYRTERYNRRAGGAAGSRHKWFEAVDLVPSRPWDRAGLHRTLLQRWRTRGPSTRMGLGLYSRTRFHVDTHRHRRW